jgi:D-glycero-D-manno-heptose 1,7-bisphosphate phosphatase
MRAAVFLDRDGVINEAPVRFGKPLAPRSLDEVVILPGVDTALAALRAAGYRLVVVTNQPDVARGTLSRAAVEAMHQQLGSQLPIDLFCTCFHDDPDACECRKPKPGLLLGAARTLGIDLAASYMVGDRWRDTEAGNAAGCRSVFIDQGYDERQPAHYHLRAQSLSEAARYILDHR